MEIPAYLTLDDLKVTCIVGDLPHERDIEQDIFLDLRLQLDIARVAASDELIDTVDYTAVASLVEQVAQTGKFKMLERLAFVCAQQLFQKFSLVDSLEIHVRKPAAWAKSRTCGVEVCFNRTFF